MVQITRVIGKKPSEEKPVTDDPYEEVEAQTEQQATDGLFETMPLESLPVPLQRHIKKMKRPAYWFIICGWVGIVFILLVAGPAVGTTIDTDMRDVLNWNYTTQNHTAWPSVSGSFLSRGTPLPGYAFSIYYMCFFSIFFTHTILSAMIGLWFRWKVNDCQMNREAPDREMVQKALKTSRRAMYYAATGYVWATYLLIVGLLCMAFLISIGIVMDTYNGPWNIDYYLQLVNTTELQMLETKFNCTADQPIILQWDHQNISAILDTCAGTMWYEAAPLACALGILPLPLSFAAIAIAMQHLHADTALKSLVKKHYQL